MGLIHDKSAIKMWYDNNLSIDIMQTSFRAHSYMIIITQLLKLFFHESISAWIFSHTHRLFHVNMYPCIDFDHLIIFLYVLINRNGENFAKNLKTVWKTTIWVH